MSSIINITILLIDTFLQDSITFSSFILYKIIFILLLFKISNTYFLTLFHQTQFKITEYQLDCKLKQINNTFRFFADISKKCNPRVLANQYPSQQDTYLSTQSCIFPKRIIIFQELNPSNQIGILSKLSRLCLIMQYLFIIK
ncbi:hypothetical protein pb186bvf_018006 [Paramecium bursaria]